MNPSTSIDGEEWFTRRHCSNGLPMSIAVYLGHFKCPRRLIYKLKLFLDKLV